MLRVPQSLFASRARSGEAPAMRASSHAEVKKGSPAEKVCTLPDPFVLRDARGAEEKKHA